MKISILQYSNSWMNADENLAYIQEQLATLPQDIELLVLTEMFTTGVTIDVKDIAETMDGKSMTALKQMASDYDIAICGSILIQEKGNYYNRFVFVKPSGEVQTYDKRHRFTMGLEHTVITAGTSCDIIEYNGWRIKPQICYDLRFPVWSRNTENYDVLIYVSNWPKARDYAYETLLRARAIENQCFVCACNRTGVDGSKIVYNGNSQVIDAKGQTLAEAKDKEGPMNCDLSKKDLEIFRKRFPVLDDGDAFEVTI